MLKNAPFLITIGVDTAENEPRKGADDVFSAGQVPAELLTCLGPFSAVLLGKNPWVRGVSFISRTSLSLLVQKEKT